MGLTLILNVISLDITNNFLDSCIFEKNKLVNEGNGCRMEYLMLI